jgi:hypothetical protein
VWPAAAEVVFRDERYADPVNAQARFDAAVFNAPDCRVTWDVRSLDGGPGAGQIDATGLYTAPDRGSLASGHTEIIVATAHADRFRRAFAHVTLVGHGPLPAPVPTILIQPQRVNLYYRAGGDSAWMDPSNQRQVFRAIVQHSTATLNWYVGGNALPEPEHGRQFHFLPAATSGADTVVAIRAELATDPTVRDEAKVVLVNYSWPGIV